MAFFVPFVLGAAATIAGLHIFNNRKKCTCGCEDGECTCGCGDDCECDPDCDCGCNSSIKKKVASKADFALEKIKSGLHTLESNITEATADKIKEGLQTVKTGLQTAESKITQFQTKLKDEKPESKG